MTSAGENSVSMSEIQHVAVTNIEQSIAFYRDIPDFRKTLDMSRGKPF
jgi:hypothetical protein